MIQVYLRDENAAHVQQMIQDALKDLVIWLRANRHSSYTKTVYVFLIQQSCTAKYHSWNEWATNDV